MFEEQKERIGYTVAEKLEETHSRQRLFFILAASGVANILCWFAALLTPDSIAEWIAFAMDLSDKFFFYLLLIPLSFAFLFAYSACRLLPNKNPTSSIEDDDFFTGYRETQKKDNHRNIILVSGMVGAANAILLAVAVIWFRSAFNYF